MLFDSVTGHAGVATDIKAILKIGTAQETVEVNTNEAPLLETTSNTIGGTIDVKQIENLPTLDRDLQSLSQYVPGFTQGAPGDGGGDDGHQQAQAAAW